MGLDIVEFVIAVEGALDIHIPDKDAERLETPPAAHRLPLPTS
jgi:acyl carrier protein